MGRVEPVETPAPQRREVRIPMRDGVHLAGDLYLPAAERRFPVLIEATPYNRRAGPRRALESSYWTANGYGLLIVDTRGSYGSEGETGFFAPDIEDGYDLVEWAARQPWATGRIGMRGASYSGTNQWMAAKAGPPHLECLVPNCTVGRFMEELPRNGGAFKLRWAIEWLQLLKTDGQLGPPVDEAALLAHRPLRTLDEVVTGAAIKTFREFVDHDTFDDYWRRVQLTDDDFRRIALPTLAFSGWFDGTLPGTIFHFTHMRRHSPAAQDQHLIIGPWEHGTAGEGGHNPFTGEPVRQVGDLAFPEHAFLPGRDLTRRFYDFALKDAPKPDLPAARIYITGADRWLDLPDYPPPAAEVRSLYLHGGGTARLGSPGRLDWAGPGDEPPDRYVYDPASPVPEWVERNGARVRTQCQPIDIRSLQDRPDVLVFETEPLTEPLTVVGNVILELFAASSARDTDFTSHVADVQPDGRAIKLGPQSGANLRARYRNGFDEAQLLTPEEPARLRLDHFDIGHRFGVGHRLRVSITSSNFPWISANPNTGNPIGSDVAPPIPARQTVFHDLNRPSRLMLPVLKTARG